MAGRAVYRKVAGKMGAEAAKSLLYGGGGQAINAVYKGDEGYLQGTAGNLSNNGMKKMLAEYYAAKPEDFSFTEVKKGRSVAYAISKGSKTLDGIAIYKKGNRYRLSLIDKTKINNQE